ncbi:MAG: hypothetical protein AAGJ38_03160 [Planctomycetota bacterium]
MPTQLRTAANLLPTPRMLGVLMACLLVGLGTTGCRKSPLPSDAPRSPYERYDALRGQTVPKTVTDSFGREQPNLRGRLGQGG